MLDYETKTCKHCNEEFDLSEMANDDLCIDCIALPLIQVYNGDSDNEFSYVLEEQLC